MMLLMMLASAFAADCHAIVGATLHQGEAAAPATIVWEGARLRAVGAEVALPEGCDAQDGTGLHVTPGLIVASTELGLVEVNAEASTRDTDAGGGAIRASALAIDGFNPSSVALPVVRQGGITAAITSLSGGFISGVSAGVRTSGLTQVEAEIQRMAALRVNLRADGGIAGGIARLRTLVEDARVYAARSGTRRFEGVADLSAPRAELDALLPFVAGRADQRRPLLIAVNRASEIEAVLRVSSELGLRVIIEGGAEAWRHASALAAAGVPVILDPTEYGPGGFNASHARADGARILAEAGVKLILTDFQTHQARALRVVAGNAVREGLPHASAIAALTRHPADAFGLTDRGALEAGALADLAVWDGDPLEIQTRLVRLVQDGEDVSTRSRQDALTEVWRTLPRRYAPGGPSPHVAPQP